MLKKRWKYQYGEYRIEVQNTIGGSELYVNGRICDQNHGLSFAEKLSATLPTGVHVKASVGGIFSPKCSLFINDELQDPVACD